MNPKAGREEKTRKMARAKIINLPSLPVKLPCNLKVADLVIARLRRPQGRGRAAMAAFLDPSGCAAFVQDNRR